MTPRALLESALRETFPDDEGTPRRIKLIPPGKGLNEHYFRENFKHPIPPDMKDLYAFVSRFALHYDEVQFTEYRTQYHDFLFDDWLEIVADGCGNHWVLEIRPGAESWGPIWFVCHDPPTTLHIADDLTTFLQYFLDAHRTRDADNPFTRSHQDACDLCGRDPRWPTAGQLRSSTDPLLAELVHNAPDHAEVIDLRTSIRGFTIQSYDVYAPASRRAHPLLFALLPES